MCFVLDIRADIFLLQIVGGTGEIYLFFSPSIVSSIHQSWNDNGDKTRKGGIKREVDAFSSASDFVC